MTRDVQVVTPANAQEVEQVVRSAIDDGTPLQVVGGDSKRSMGYPARKSMRLSTAKLDRIVDYDPAELVLTVGAGTRLRAIESLLAAHDQRLAFEPYDFAMTVGASSGASTIGGVVAAGFAGSRRVSAGNVRDHLLGFTAVSGRGETFVAGGRVVKNVTGYDLPKLMCGSWGQLAVLTELTLKVLPTPRRSLTLAAVGLDDDRAYGTMTRALRSQADVAAAAYVPAGLIEARSQILLRLEGFGPSVEARALLLQEVVDTQLVRVESALADTPWSRVCAAELLREDSNAVLWRVCVPGTQGARVCAGIRALGGSMLIDWGGALIWAKLSSEVEAQRVRALAESAGGHATLVNAPDAYRANVPALHPESPAVGALAKRVKAAFDPSGILDPFRFEVPAT